MYDTKGLVWPFPNNTRITTPWNQMRPVSNPSHFHGAIDIATLSGSAIIAPESGTVVYYNATRPEGKDGKSIYWKPDEMVGFPFKNYFYDIYGTCAILQGRSGITHLFAHLYQNPTFNNMENKWNYVEEKEDKRFPLHCYITEPEEIFAEAEIGLTGNAGFSSGPHCHYELHEGYKWQDWKDRIDPEKIEWKDFK